MRPGVKLKVFYLPQFQYSLHLEQGKKIRVDLEQIFIDLRKNIWLLLQ